MNDNNFADIPDLNQALSLTEQYEEYRYLRVWGLFLLIDAIVLFMSITAFNNLITRRADLLGFKMLLKTGLTLLQFFILLILVIKIGRTNKKTRLKLGKIAVATHWVFLIGLIGLKLFFTMIEWTLNFAPANYIPLLIVEFFRDYYLSIYILIQSFSLTLYYIFMKKMISKHNFKEIRNAIFFLLGWDVFIYITLYILHIDEYFGWNEITITLYSLDSGIGFSSYDVLVFGMIVYYITDLIFVICEALLGIIAFTKSDKLLSGEISEKT
ncbi:MAG: hypothetical protein ACTSPA_03140 [Promethearchaeota archaeon]